MKFGCLFVVTALVCSGLVELGWADQPAGMDHLKKENAELHRRVDRLERELKEIKQLLLQRLAPQPTTQPACSGGSHNARERAAVLKTIEKELDSRAGKPVMVPSGLEIDLYGYVKLDAAADTARTDVGNFARWVDPQQDRTNDDQFNMTARQTRVGLKIRGPDAGPVKTSGLVEADFYGGGTENKPEPRMRHAYMKLDWPEERFSILAGQTWDVISPLYPDTLNFTILWWSGNIGWRRPQIRVTKEATIAENVDLKVEGAVARTIGHDAPFDPGDSGEDAALPGIQGRLALALPLLGDRRTVLGFSGHYACEEFDLDSQDRHVNLASWSANMDLVQPITRWLTLKGEMHVGKNLDAYLGGIGQGIDATTKDEIGACGGWLAATLGPWDKWLFNVGAGVETIDASDVSSGSARTLNRSVFGNVTYQINPNAIVGFELSHWHTGYKGLTDGDSLRFQTSFIYKF